VLDTKNLFGFLEGADVGEKDDRSLEFETTGSFGEAQGLYRSSEQEFIFENALTDSFGLELGAHVLGQDIRRASEHFTTRSTKRLICPPLSSSRRRPTGSTSMNSRSGAAEGKPPKRDSVKSGHCRTCCPTTATLAAVP
jgi:hypothetical protein